MSQLTFSIADIVIRMRSRFPHLPFEGKGVLAGRFTDFLCQNSSRADICITIDVVRELPRLSGAKDLYITYHYQDGSENWRMVSREDVLYYRSPLAGRNLIARINRSFDRVTVFVLAKGERERDENDLRECITEHHGLVWDVNDIIYDFLQVLLMCYLARTTGDGLFVHAVGMRDCNGKGYLFAGKSGSGKTTMARLWHRYSRACILNDDRVIIRRRTGKFTIYSSPWHGDFSDYLRSSQEQAPLETVYFLRHAPENQARVLSPKQMFTHFYRNIFPIYWEREEIVHLARFIEQLTRQVPCFTMGFRKDKAVINWIRKRGSKRKDDHAKIKI